MSDIFDVIFQRRVRLDLKRITARSLTRFSVLCDSVNDGLPFGFYTSEQRCDSTLASMNCFDSVFMIPLSQSLLIEHAF